MIKMKLIPRFLIQNLKAGEKMRWIYQLMGFVSDWASNYLNLFTNKSIGAERKNFQSDPESLTVKAGELRKTAKTILYVLINTVFFSYYFSFCSRITALWKECHCDLIPPLLTRCDCWFWFPRIVAAGLIS